MRLYSGQMSNQMPPFEGDSTNLHSSAMPHGFEDMAPPTQSASYEALDEAMTAFTKAAMAAKQSAATTPQEELARSGVFNQARTARLFGVETGFSAKFEESLEIHAAAIPHTYSQNDKKRGYALSEASAFTLSIMPDIPRKDVVVTAANLAEHDWFEHSRQVLRQSDKPADFIERLWDPEAPICQALEQAGRTREQILGELFRESSLLGKLHLLRADRFQAVKDAYDPSNPNGKYILSIPTEITESDISYSLQEFIKGSIEPHFGGLAWANLSDKGDKYSTQLQYFLKRIKVLGDCVILSSTRVHIADPSDPFGSAEWKANHAPHTRLTVADPMPAFVEVRKHAKRNTAVDKFYIALGEGMLAYPTDARNFQPYFQPPAKRKS